MRFGVCVRALDALLGSLRGCLERFPDKRRGLNTTYPMGDIRMAAFSVFFMQSPSFLAHQRQFEAGQALSNATTLFGVTRIPSDNHIRDMLDPASPALLHPVFAAAVDQIRQIEGGLGHFRRLDGRLLIALYRLSDFRPGLVPVLRRASARSWPPSVAREFPTVARPQPCTTAGLVTIRYCRCRWRTTTS